MSYDYEEMNLDFTNGVQLRFGMGLDSGPCMDDEPLIGVQRVGPRGLLAELERSLGLPSVELGVTDRVSRFQERIDVSGAECSDAFWSASFSVDRYAVAGDLLKIRDALVMAGWDFTVEDRAPRRLLDLSRLERGADLSGLADRYRAVVAALSAGAAEERIPGIAAIECAEKRETLPPPWARLLTLLETAGLPVTENPVVFPVGDDSEMSNRARLLAILRDDNREVFLDHERSLFVLRGGTVAEFAQHIARGSVGMPIYGPRRAIIAPKGSASLAAAFAWAGAPRPEAAADPGVPPVGSLVRTVPVFLFDPVDIDRLAEFLSVRPNPLGSTVARRLLRALRERPGTGSARWVAEVDRLDEKQRTAYTKWFGLDRVTEGALCPSAVAVEPFRHLGDWARRMAHTQEDTPIDWRSLESVCRQIAAELSASYSDGISRLQLEQLIRRMSHIGNGMTAEAGSVSVLDSPGQLDVPVDTLVWMPFCESESSAGRLYHWLREDERRWLAGRGVRIESPEDIATRERADVARVVAMARAVWLIVPDQQDGEELAPHRVYRFLAARQVPSSFTRTPEEILTPPAEIASVPPPEQRSEWRLSGIPRDALERSISFSRLNTLFTAPHAWVAEYAARFTTPQDAGVPQGPHLYGILAHDIANAWFSRTDWHTRRAVDFTAWFATAFDRYIYTDAMSLARPGREAERARVRAVTHDGVLALDRLLRERSWHPADTETDLSGSFAGRSVHGRADLLCTTGGGDAMSVIIDLKWQGERKRTDEVESGTAWQLAFYAAISGAPPDEALAGYFILDRRRLIPLEPGDPMTRTMTAMEELYRQRCTELEEGRVVLPAPNDLTSWDVYRFLVGWGS
jgi:hypothetical protein